MQSDARGAIDGAATGVVNAMDDEASIDSISRLHPDAIFPAKCQLRAFPGYVALSLRVPTRHPSEARLVQESRGRTLTLPVKVSPADSCISTRVDGERQKSPWSGRSVSGSCRVHWDRRSAVPVVDVKSKLHA